MTLRTSARRPIRERFRPPNSTKSPSHPHPRTLEHRNWLLGRTSEHLKGLGRLQVDRGKTPSSANLSNVNASHFLQAATAGTDEDFQKALENLRRQGSRNPHVEAQITFLLHQRRQRGRKT